MARNTRAAAQLTFHKYQGLGNNFILVDNRGQADLLVDSERAIRWCDKYYGIGGDGVIFALPPHDGMDLSMRLFNSDGSEPEMCGNGIRCLAKFVADVDGASTGKYRVHTLAGEIVPELLDDGRVRVDMGQPQLAARDVPTTLAEGSAQAVAVPVTVGANDYSITAVGMGNPHAVIYERNSVMYNVDEIDLSTIGPQFERHDTFPSGTNTEFVQVMSRSYVKMVVWERGAGRTLACGTGACATVVAGVLEGKIDRSCTVELPGGPLDIEWDESSNHVFMTGPAERVFVGQADI